MTAGRSEFSPERIFISYSRADGRAFAEALERRLDEEGIRSWRDLKSMESGDIRPQVLRAIEGAQHLVLVLSWRALQSDWVRREWTHARLKGRRVSPVLADQSIKRSDLPAWIRREEVYDLAERERWDNLVAVLNGPGEVRRVPYMAGDLPDPFVPRPAEYNALKGNVLWARTGTAVGVTTALHGAGGYGKTTLANALCRDPEVRFEFADGILRVEVGKERGDVTGLLLDLIKVLDPKAPPREFNDVNTAAEHLTGLIGEARLLLVVDDVWREAQLRPFLRGGPNCVRLVTTRLPRVLPASHAAINIDEMRAKEALDLLSAGLPVERDPAARLRLAALAKRLEHWAQMLGIANGWIRSRISAGEQLGDVVARFEQRLGKRGLAAFDPKQEVERDRAIRACVEASLEDLDLNELARLCELAVVPEDEDVPLGAVEALWAETGKLDEDDMDDLVRRFHSLSLLQGLDLGARTLRLHDNMLWYLRDRVGLEGVRAAHDAMVRALRKACEGDWAMLPVQHGYGWRNLVRHLRGAGQDGEADRLLTDYAWIKAKLRAFDPQRAPQELFASYLPEPQDEAARLVGRAVALSLPALAASRREFPRQLFGRLGGIEHAAAAALAAAAQEDADFRPAPRWPGLTPPGPEQIRLVGHEGGVWCVAFSPDGARVVTASHDRTARIWDATTASELAVLRGHDDEVGSAAFTPDGARVVTASHDGTVRVWDIALGTEPVLLCKHEDEVRGAAFSSDGTRVITASHDGTARVWDAVSGNEIVCLVGHRKWVPSAAFSPDGARVVTASYDRTGRVWHAISGRELTRFSGHKEIVWSAAFSPDGARVVTASHDGTARVWDAVSGAEVTNIRGHEGEVESGTFSPDGTRIVTGSWDGTARLWDAKLGTELALLRGHESGIRSTAFSPDGARIVTGSWDGTAGLWDVTSSTKYVVPNRHEGGVHSIALSPDGVRIVTGSWDGTARFWDAVTGSDELHPVSLDTHLSEGRPER